MDGKRKKEKYVLVMIDYFTRIPRMKMLEQKPSTKHGERILLRKR
jgi:hypothetical protein